jgi:hypothetical protein
MSYHDILLDLPPHYRREWHRYRSEEMQQNQQWALLDRAAAALALSAPDLSGELESWADDIMGAEADSMFSDFLEWMGDRERDAGER